MLALLLAADLLILLFYVLHVVCRPLGAFQDEYWALETDRGFGETFQYVQTFWAAAMLLVVFLRTREVLFLAWSALFGVVMLDDSLQGHERAGVLLSQHLGLRPRLGLRPEDLGELVALAIAGMLLLSFLAAAYGLASAPARRAGRHLALVSVGLVLAGAFLDALHIASRGTPFFHPLGVAEDWGELLAMSTACAYAFHLFTGGSNRLLAAAAEEGAAGGERGRE